MFAYIGLTYRFAPLERSAEVVKLDLDSGEVVCRKWLPPPLYDLTAGDRPGGGGRQRGARGVLADGTHLHVATFDSIIVLDAKLNELARISNERCNDIHEFLIHDGHYILTSTHADAVVWCDLTGAISRVWVATEDPRLLRAFPDVSPRRMPRDCDWRNMYPKPNHTHLNAISVRDGETFVALHHQAVLWSVDKGAIHHDARPAMAGKTHNHQIFGRAIYLNDTLNGRLLLDEGKGIRSLDLSQYGICGDRPAGLSAPWAVEHGWLRGLCLLGEGCILAGQCPATVLLISANPLRVMKDFRISDDWRVSVHGIGVQAL